MERRADAGNRGGCPPYPLLFRLLLPFKLFDKMESCSTAATTATATAAATIMYVLLNTQK